MAVSRLSLNALRAFEATARLRSFSAAATELSVTHGAVSRHIRMLEDWGPRCSGTKNGVVHRPGFHFRERHRASIGLCGRE